MPAQPLSFNMLQGLEDGMADVDASAASQLHDPAARLLRVPRSGATSRGPGVSQGCDHDHYRAPLWATWCFAALQPLSC